MKTKSATKSPRHDDAAKVSTSKTARTDSARFARSVLGLSVGWPATGGVELIELARLLAALERSPRMAAAAQALELSYRTAWGRLVAAEQALGARLVERIKGHGSRLTPAGRALLAATTGFEEQARALVEAPLARLAAAVAGLSVAPVPALRMAASHDLLLQRCIAERQVAGITLRFVGSEQALAALSRGDVDLAGFHRPAGGGPAGRGDFAAGVGSGAAFIVALARREQGLIVAPGNPMRIRDVSDLARTGLRFVNRQRGAATRSWLDRLLREGHIDPERIAGYGVEETTHLAVAATVAAGEADAGFGLRAAAERFGLGFVPIGSEVYWLAGSAALRGDPRIRTLVEAVRGLAEQTPGYRAPVPGTDFTSRQSIP